MLNPRKTVDLIISTLRHKENLGDPFALRSIAEDYATLCADVVARLDQCKTLLANRDEFGAWTLLATPPELFELIEILGFAQLGEWRELCLKNALPVAAEFDAYTIEKLEKLYSSKYIKNISENHFLYAAYRRAMRLKNEDDAFRSLNAIVRANPHDTTSRTAYRAIEDKQQRKLIAKLKEKLDVVTANETPENITAALDALAEIEQTIWQDPPVSKTLDAGRALAEKVELAEALETARKFLDNANSLAADGHHIVAESYLVEFDALAKKHAFVLSPAEQAKLQTLRETLASAAAHRAKVEKQRKVVAALETELARQESLLSVHTRKIPVLEKDQTTVVHLWKELETLAIPVTEQLHNRYQKVIENTDIEISRKRRNRVISIVAAILLGISATGAGAFYLYETNEITKLAQKCAEAPKSNSVPVAEGILALAEKHPRRAATATVAPALAQLREWVARNKQLFATYTAQKTTAGDAINKVTPDASFEVVSTAETAFSTLDAAFKKLAANYQKSEELPLADLRVAWDGKRATWETEMHNRFAAKIQHHEQRINYAKKESTYLKSIEKDGEK
ncbi:MAG: hypothetical protein LBR07_05655, partial [Puniceicoccales bacterium]|nr:hypothetical protein [Puniceicoccales bacterium]